MAKNVYIGVGGVARKVKGMYIGVNGAARKVKKGYIGVNGVAQQFYNDGIPVTLSGGLTSAVVAHNGMNYSPPAAFNVNAGDIITFSPGASGLTILKVTVNGSDVYSGTQYSWTVPVVGAISITATMGNAYPLYFAQYTVTTS